MAAEHTAAETSRKPLVAFLGPVSSFTHQATKSAFSDSEWELMPVVTIKDVFEVVQAGHADYGVVPFENSTHGPVTFTLDSLADRDGSLADLSVCAEIYLDVHHFLLGRAVPPSGPEEDAALATPPQQQQQQQQLASSSSSSTTPSSSAAAAAAAAGTASPDGSGTCTPTASHPHPARPRARPLGPLGHVRRVYSHPQAFGQTAAFLGAYLRGVDTLEATSTSRAAQLAAADPTGRSAAIAGEIAAEVHGLDVLARCIEDREDNTTRFFVVRRGQGPAPPELAGARRRGEDAVRCGEGTDEAAAAAATTAAAEAGDEEEAGGRGRGQGGGPGPTKTLVSFTVPHRAPGALADVLDVFRTHGLNLTSINSVPSLIRPFQYLFFVEFEGSRHEDPDGRVEAALAGVDKVAQRWRWLGSWVNQRP